MDIVNQIRQELVEEAASWINTPYLYGGKQKEKGVDCSEFAVDPYRAKGIIDPRTQIPRVHRDWIFGRDVNPHVFRDFILKFCVVVPFDSRLPADLITFMFNGIESHVAILESLVPDRILHAVTNQRVRRQRLGSMSSVVAVYRPKPFLSHQSLVEALTLYAPNHPQLQRNGSDGTREALEIGKSREIG